MISEIQTKLQKHNKIVFTVLLAIIIVAFVFTIGNMPGIGGAEPQTVRSDYFGYNLQSERDVRELLRFGEISYRIENGEGEINPNQLQSYVLDRIAFENIADSLKIPSPTEEEFRYFVSGRPAFQKEDGGFDPNRYSSFLDNLEVDSQFSENDFAWVLEQDFRIEKARKLTEGPGYVLPAEVRLQLQRNKELWSVDLASFSLADFQPEIEVTDEKLEEFFEENSFRYEREPRTAFYYALFERENFLDDVPELSEKELTAHFEQNRSQFTPEEEEKTEEADEEKEEEEAKEVTLADVKEKVEASLRRQKAIRVAGLAAADFVYELSQREVRPDSEEDFNQFLSNHKAELHEAPAVSQSEFPGELGFSREAQDAVFRLDEGRDFSDPVRIRDDYAVLIFKETIPSAIPPLEEVKERVENDFRSEERRRLLTERGEEIRDSLVAQIKDGKSFEEAAEAEELDFQSIDEFSRLSPPEQLNRQLIMRLDEFEEKKVSRLVQLQNLGYFVYVKERKTPEIDTSDDEFAETAENLRVWSSMSSNFSLQEFIREKTSAANSR